VTQFHVWRKGAQVLCFSVSWWRLWDNGQGSLGSLGGVVKVQMSGAVHRHGFRNFGGHVMSFEKGNNSIHLTWVEIIGIRKRGSKGTHFTCMNALDRSPSQSPNGASSHPICFHATQSFIPNPASDKTSNICILVSFLFAERKVTE